jgi:hypothetical protein
MDILIENNGKVKFNKEARSKNDIYGQEHGHEEERRGGKCNFSSVY